MDATLAATLGGVAGFGICGVAVLAYGLSQRSLRPSTDRAVREVRRAVGPSGAGAADVPDGLSRVLAVLRSITILLGPDDAVVQASASARAYGLVSGSRLALEELRGLVDAVRDDGEIRQTDLALTRTPATGALIRDIASMSARVAPLDRGLVLVLVEDRTKERRLDAIRRDFTANVSHELKTPVGALTVLAEAVQHAADDPEAVHRFAGRMQIESERLTRLVQQIIELSRVQGDDLLDAALPVSVDAVVDAALDRSRVDAQAKTIDLVRLGTPALEVIGSEQQLLVALGNLVENAVGYSPPGTKVVVHVRAIEHADRRGDRPAAAAPSAVSTGASGAVGATAVTGAGNGGLAGPGAAAAGLDADPGAEEGPRGLVEIAVSDQGAGIPEDELARVFERFYRVDRARSRETGGTGLGLSIVKHVAAAHGGDVSVHSVAGHGSTFTLRLPLWTSAAAATAGAEGARSVVPPVDIRTPAERAAGR